MPGIDGLEVCRSIELTRTEFLLRALPPPSRTGPHPGGDLGQRLGLRGEPPAHPGLRGALRAGRGGVGGAGRPGGGRGRGRGRPDPWGRTPARDRRGPPGGRGAPGGFLEAATYTRAPVQLLVRGFGTRRTCPRPSTGSTGGARPSRCPGPGSALPSPGASSGRRAARSPSTRAQEGGPGWRCGYPPSSLPSGKPASPLWRRHPGPRRPPGEGPSGTPLGALRPPGRPSPGGPSGRRSPRRRRADPR